MEIINVEGVAKNFGDITALADVSFTVPHGNITALLGHNGAGKSTLIKILLGLLESDSGRVVIDGSFQGIDVMEVKTKVGYLPEKVSFYDNLTALENLQFYALLRRLPETRCWEVLETVGLKEAARRRVGGFSKGMIQRLGLAQAILNHPAVLVLDEPTSGLDPLGVIELKTILKQINDQGTTILFSSHIMAEVAELARQLVILNHGRVVFNGSVEGLLSHLGHYPLLRLKLARQKADRARQAVLAAGAISVHDDEDGLLVYFREGHLYQVLSSLVQESLEVWDFQVVTPSLEEAYLHVLAKEA